MTIGILTTGDEIVHGDTLNTNGRDLAHILCSEGLSLGFHLSCSDKEKDIVTSLKFLTKEHDIIIIIGGLGPTTDDITRFALAKWTGEPLIQHQEALKHVTERLAKARVSMNPGNLQQCLFPAKAIMLPNPHGSALGCFYTSKDKTYFLLPGPPRECLPMFNAYVLPRLVDVVRSQKHLLKWRIFGLAESEIGYVLENALAEIDCQTGYRLEVPYVEFKVRCKPNLVATVKQIVDPILAPHVIARDNKKASDELHDMIVKIKKPITILDDVTGGVLQSLLIRPDTKDLIYFYNHKKTNLNFHLKGLVDYWQQKPCEGVTQLTIHYGNHHQEGREMHEVPYRTPLVVYYAAEWLSFRLFHLINQLHQ